MADLSPTEDTTVKIGDREIALRYTAKSVRILEKSQDKSILQILQGLAGDGVRVDVLMALIVAGTNGTVTTDQLEDMEIGELYGLVRPVAAAVIRSMPKADSKNAPATGSPIELIG